VRRPWIFACSFAVVAWACDEKFPQELGPGSPPAPIDAGIDATQDGGVVPKGTRTLGIEVVIDSLQFPQQVNAVFDAGGRTTNASFTWYDDVERPFAEIPDASAADADADADADAASGNEGGTIIFNAGFHIVGLVLGESHVRASLAVAALDRTGPRLPPDLAGRALDDVAVTSRYDAITDYVFTQIIDLELDAYLVALDVDATLGTDAAKWTTFASFVSKVGAHVRTKRPNLKVGFTLSAAALAEKKDLAAAALAASDVVVVTEPESFDAIVDAAPAGKPIFIHHIALGGLTARDAFVQWDRFAERVPIVTFPAVSADLVREARARGF
jgi:hypothetical protein